MKEKTLKHLNTLLEEYSKGEAQLQIDLLNEELKENELLEIDSELKEISSKVKEVKECINYISNLPDFVVIDYAERKKVRINPHFIIEFKNELERIGLLKKFEEEIKLKKFPEHINLENIGSYENDDNWNEFLHIVDYYYPGILIIHYRDIPYQNYATKVLYQIPLSKEDFEKGMNEICKPTKKNENN